jgi:thioredoxin 1
MENNNGVHELSEAEFQDFTKDGLAIIDFFADWCMPCLIMAPIMEELSKKFQGKIKFGKIDVDENEELARKFKIFSIPNFILFRGGNPIDRFVGSIPAQDFEEKLKKHVK